MKPSAKQQPIVKPVTLAAGRSGASMIEVQAGMWERISQRAYGLWRQRGCREGYALRDWMDAEVMVIEEFHEARE